MAKSFKFVHFPSHILKLMNCEVFSSKIMIAALIFIELIVHGFPLE